MRQSFKINYNFPVNYHMLIKMFSQFKDWVREIERERERQRETKEGEK